MDNHTPEQRRKNMQAIKSNNTEIEQTLRIKLWAQGIRYRKNYKKLIGKPDIAITKYKIAVFCDSEFWHGKNFDENACRIGTNRSYWVEKIKRNIDRDRKVTQLLQDEGWTVLRFWEKEIRKETDSCILRILEAIAEVKKQT